MPRTARRYLTVLLVSVLAGGLVPVAVLAAPRLPDPHARAAAARRHAPRSTGVRASDIPTYPADAFDPSDDTTAGARDLTAYVSGIDPVNGWGKAPFEEGHTLATATIDTTLSASDAQADFDWFKFTVDDQDVLDAKVYLIEAKSTSGLISGAYTDPVIEVYGPVISTATIDPQDPRALYEASPTVDVDPNAVAANDNGDWFGLGFSSSVSFVPSEAGTYYVRVRPYFGASLDASGDVSERGYLNGAGPYTLRLKVGVITRLSGPLRTDTAVRVSNERYADGELPAVSYDGTGTVIIACSDNFPDALAASTLAGALNSPILLTPTASLPGAVSAEITRLGARRAIIVGGTTAVSATVANRLAGLVHKVERIAGSGRVQTAAKIAERANEEMVAQPFGGGTAPLAFIASSQTFPDALSASPMAARNVAPILLTNPASLDASASGALAPLNVTDVVIVGSTNAVSSRVATQLANQLGGWDHVRRVGGADRYETSHDLAVWATSLGTTDTVGTTATPDALYTLDTDGLIVANGANYPDALGGGAFAGLAYFGYPLLLTQPPPATAPSQWIIDSGGTPLPAGKVSYLDSLPDGPYTITRGYIIGGPAAVAPGVWTTLDELVSGPRTF